MIPTGVRSVWSKTLNRLDIHAVGRRAQLWANFELRLLALARSGKTNRVVPGSTLLFAGTRTFAQFCKKRFGRSPNRHPDPPWEECSPKKPVEAEGHA